MDQIQTALGAVGIYAALNFFILCWLGNATGAVRRTKKISIGDGGDKYLARLMRGHANASENMPMFFIGLTLGALIGMPLIAVHLIGLVFTLGRAMHAHHFIQEDAPFKTRMYGFGLAFLAMALLFIGLLGHGVWTLLAG